MTLRPSLAFSLLTLAALAGCSDGPASGQVVAIPGVQAADGASVNTYQAEYRPYDTDVDQVPDVCAPPQAPQQVERCREAATHFDIHFMSLPEPDGNGYRIFLGGGAEGGRQVAQLGDEGNGMWGLNITLDEDLTGQFERLELRMGTFVFASAPAAAGSQAFVTEPALSAVAVTASYRGNVLSLDVANLPPDAEYVGRLYTRASPDANLTLVESFPVVPGPQEFVAEQHPIGDYAEFHIHVGNSKIYVYQGTIE